MSKQKLGIIGFGQFGQFMAGHLAPHFEVVFYARQDQSAEAENYGIRQVSLAEIADCDIVVLAIPVQNQAELLQELAPLIKKKLLFIDVSSVKMKPVELMKKYLPERVEIIGTHPVFGPQSGKEGIVGLKLIFCSVRSDDNTEQSVLDFFKNKLKLQVLRRTPEEHDRQMAHIQALTHLIGRVVNQMDIPDLDEKTESYQQLLDLKDLLKNDSLELFQTIQKENPFSREVVKRFQEEVDRLVGGN